MSLTVGPTDFADPGNQVAQLLFCLYNDRLEIPKVLRYIIAINVSKSRDQSFPGSLRSSGFDIYPGTRQ